MHYQPFLNISNVPNWLSFENAEIHVYHENWNPHENWAKYHKFVN